MLLNPIIPIVTIATYVHMNVDVNVKNIKRHVANGNKIVVIKCFKLNTTARENYNVLSQDKIQMKTICQPKCPTNKILMISHWLYVYVTEPEKTSLIYT